MYRMQGRRVSILILVHSCGEPRLQRTLGQSCCCCALVHNRWMCRRDLLLLLLLWSPVLLLQQEEGRCGCSRSSGRQAFAHRGGSDYRGTEAERVLGADSGWGPAWPAALDHSALRRDVASDSACWGEPWNANSSRRPWCARNCASGDCLQRLSFCSTGWLFRAFFAMARRAVCA